MQGFIIVENVTGDHWIWSFTLFVEKWVIGNDTLARNNH